MQGSLYLRGKEGVKGKPWFPLLWFAVCAMAAIEPSPTYLPTETFVYKRTPSNTFANNTVFYEIDTATTVSPPSVALIQIATEGSPFEAAMVRPLALVGVPPSPFLAVPITASTGGQSVVRFAVIGVDVAEKSAYGVKVVLSSILKLNIGGASTGEHTLNPTRPYAAYYLDLAAENVLRYPALLILTNTGTLNNRCSHPVASTRLMLGSVPLDRKFQYNESFAGAFEENGQGAVELAVTLGIRDSTYLGRYYIGLGWRQSNWMDQAEMGYTAYFNLNARIEYPTNLTHQVLTTTEEIESFALYYHESESFYFQMPRQPAYPVFVRIRLEHRGASIMVNKGHQFPTPEHHLASNTQVDGKLRFPSTP